MLDDTQERVNLVRSYKEAVLSFESLENEVDTLLQSRGGHTQDLSDDEFQRYRELQERRDLAYNHMKNLERLLLNE